MINLTLVSIIIPCYRQGRFLQAAIESALGQSYHPKEVIVVNDGSDDETDVVARQYDARVKYISKANQGLPSARNAGIQSAEGKYLLFLDADDLLAPEAVAWLVEAVCERENCLAIMGWRNFSEGSSVGGEFGMVPPEELQLLPRILYGNLAPPNTWLCPAILVRAAGGFDEKLRSHEDWDLWVRLALSGAQLATVPRIGAYYRRSPGSMSRNLRVMSETYIEVLQKGQRYILEDTALMHKYGAELYSASREALRRIAMQRLPWPVVSPLAHSIRELEQHGVRLRRSVAKRVLTRVLGYRAELVSYLYFRYFHKAIYG
jgi:glycosyltransferase involved in cell wall biosynthesis